MKIVKLFFLIFIAGLSCVINENCAMAQTKSDFYWFYVGTYTGAKSKGIYYGKYEPVSGKIESKGLGAQTTSPSFLAVHPNNKYLYAVNEANLRSQGEGGVSAFQINQSTGELTEINQTFSGGNSPCHLTTDRTGKYLLVVNYGSGTVACFKLNKNGGIGEKTAQIQHTGSGTNPSRQKGPHAHWVGLSADNKYAFVCDLGLDKILIYKFDENSGDLKPNDPSFVKLNDGAGPRHLTFHPNEKFAFVINELDSTITALEYNNGSFKTFNTVKTFPTDFNGQNSGAEIEVHPNGKFVYGSNRGHDSIVCFEFIPDKKDLQLIQTISSGGKMPRHFAITPDGNYLLAANQSTDNLVLFKLNSNTGKLTAVEEKVEVGSPVCIIFIKPE